MPEKKEAPLELKKKYKDLCAAKINVALVGLRIPPSMRLAIQNQMEDLVREVGGQGVVEKPGSKSPEPKTEPKKDPSPKAKEPEKKQTTPAPSKPSTKDQPKTAAEQEELVRLAMQSSPATDK